MNEQRVRYSEVTLLHVLAVIIVFTEHICQRIGLSLIGELLKGVPIFLFLSGFLTGIKTGPFDHKWFKKKYVRVMLPYYLTLVVVFILYMVWGGEKFEIKQWAVLFTNLQGLTNYVFLNDGMNYYSPLAVGLGHFWYITVIMICYLLTPVINAWVKESSFSIRRIILFFTIIIFILQPLLLYYNLNINCFWLYLLGFVIARSDVKISKKLVGYSFIMMVITAGIRLIAKCLCDGSLLYNSYFASLSSDFLGLFVVVSIFYVRSIRPSLIDGIASNRLIKFIEKHLFEIYLVHHILIKGSWSVFNYIASPVWAIIVTIILTLGISYVLHLLSQKLIKAI